MRILVIDRYNMPRDLAQMDMYKAMEAQHTLTYANKFDVYKHVSQHDYDLIYLGIYHHVLKIEWEYLYTMVNTPIIIDQADNDEFINYDWKYPANSTLVSRYLPNRIEGYWGKKVYLLPWYINPERFKPAEKDVDMMFVCSIRGKRIGYNRKQMLAEVTDYANRNGMRLIAGEYWEQYPSICARSKIMVIDGSRFCLTQKYIEACLSECYIAGEKPISPVNDIRVTSLKNLKIDPKTIKHNKEYILETFANKNYFLKHFDECLTSFA
jgi:hypothetical protein